MAIHSKIRRWSGAFLLPLTLCLAGGALKADEGMWTYDNPPTQALKARYGFEPTKAWLDHVRLSSVRFNDGGSGSFVSADGLVLTNHHVARGQLQKVSTPAKDYIQNGFIAGSAAEELKCPDLELNVLVSMEDVTAKVQGAVKPGMDEKTALEARRAEMARLEKESLKATGLRSDMVTLYQGGEYWIYRYKKYTDIRLVFAPEQQAAFYGGDPDNFTFPRHDLDMALFRVYEDGKPVHTPHLKWNPKGAADGDLVFVSGHPGSTERLNTMAQLAFTRDHAYPFYMDMLKRRLAVVKSFAARGPEEARQAGSLIFGIQNSIKAIGGRLEGLRDKALMAKKAADESEFRRKVQADPGLAKAYGDVWNTIAEAEHSQLSRIKELNFRRMGGYRLPANVLSLVRYAAETAKPDAERMEEYHDAGLDSLRFRLVSPAPFYPGLEELLLADSLQQSLDQLGPQDPFVKAALGGRKPAEVAHELITGTHLMDPAARQALLEGGSKAIAASTDPLVKWVLKVDPLLREIRKWHEDKVESVLAPAGEKLGKARFAVYGRQLSPDANFTLRLTFGTVKGYPMNGTIAPSKTTFYGLYDRSASFDNKAPFNLPARYVERKGKLDLSTPLDFVASCDIIGGNSGSPVLNREGEIVGLIFDGNIESLVGNMIYDDTANRAVAVHTAGMTEALEKLYDADFLVKELMAQ
nr:S46 family peptidase [uncultured Holophaga sp.]